VKLVATDIDGTILPRTHKVSERTRAALASLAEVDVPLVLVTARPPRWLDAVARQLHITGTAVCANGAVEYDLGREQVTAHRGMNADALAHAARELRQALPGVAFALETTRGIAREDEFPPNEPGVSPVEVGRLEDMACAQDGTGVKLLALLLDGPYTSDQMLDIARPLVEGVLEVSHSSSTVPLLELSAPGITKASGLARMAEHFGVDAADVVAFGDAPNDIPMLEWAGTGYAVANAHTDVKAAATHLTASVDDDGVAQVVERIVAEARAARV